MKLTYRDRIILIGVLFVAIIAIGIFAGIRPLYKDIKENRKSLDKQQEIWTDIDKKISQIPTLKSSIETSYNDALAIAQKFTEQRDSYQIDQFIQPHIDKDMLTVNTGLQATEPMVENMEYYYYTPNVLTYPLAEAADLDGSLAVDLLQKMNTTLVLSNRTVESLVSSSVTFDFKAKKADILQFIEDIKALNATILITNVTIDDYTFGKDSDIAEDVDYSTGSITVEFYSVQAPTKPNMGK